MTPADVDVVSALVKARSGQALGPDRGYFVESRLAPVARREGFGSVGELVQTLRVRRDERLAWAVTEAMATSETAFFRERAAFDHFRDALLPPLAAARNDRVRVWSAGCATGQEPYSLAMLMAEGAPGAPRAQLEIFATDISPRRLEKAHAGLYTQFEVQRGLPVRMMIRHFAKEEESWRLAPRLRQAVSFQVANLLDDFRGFGRFDVVFCRGVLEGMDPQVRANVVERLADQIADDGALIIGARESLAGVSEAFRPAPHAPGVHVKAMVKRAAA